VKIRCPKFLGFHIVIRAEKCAEKNDHSKKIKFCIFFYHFRLEKPPKPVFFIKRLFAQL